MPVGTVAVYDPTKDAWTGGPDLPTARTDLAAATDADGQVYAIGGRTGPGHEPTDIVEVYSPSRGSWSTGTSLPSAMGDPSATRGRDGKIYVLDAKSLAIYDPDARSWSSGPGLPAGHGASVLTTLPDGRIVAAGGGQAAVSTDVFAYQPASNSPGGAAWTKLADLPSGVAAAAGATGPDGRVYVVGGRNGGGDITDDVQVYSPDNDSWAAGPTGQASMRADYAAATGGDGHVYVLGGTSGSGDTLDSVAALKE